jgi:hypothetical protein
MTYLGSEVLILQVICVLPNIDAYDGNMREKGVLIGGCENLETLRDRIHTLFTTRYDLT